LFNDPAIVLKKELLNIPIWGWYLRRSGMIPIDRAGKTKALSDMMEAAHKAAAAGRKIVIFPQGTRLPPTEWKPYKSGVAALYQELNLPVVPMTLNSGLFWPKHSFIKKPGAITVQFLPPILPGLSRDVMMERLKTELEAATKKLVEATTNPAP
jgi:1-acyl-sn-glycerol-3-phosphate acyltransferase